MAATATLIHELVTGIRDTSGLAVASGTVRFYQIGTLTPATVYSDVQATVAVSQPVTLNAAGQYLYVYATAPVRMIAKTSGAVTVVDAQVANVTASQVYIDNANVNGGTETTLDDFLTSMATTGAGVAYVESSGATARSYTSRLQDEAVSVKDFGALGDDIQDDTTFLQAAHDHCAATGKDLLYPNGTYKVTAAINVNAVTTKKYNIRGVGPKSSLIKNYGTTNSTLVFNLGGSTDWGMTVEGIGVTASTTSSGSAFSNTNANNLRVVNCEAALHRTAFGLAGATGVIADGVATLSTDGNTAAVGISVGASSRILYPRLVGSSSLGTAISSSGTDVAVICPASTGFAAAISLSGARSEVYGGNVAAVSGTGVSMAGTNSRIVGTFITVGTSATGLSMGGTVSRAKSVVISGSSSTTGISLAASSLAEDCVVSGCATSITSSAANVRVTDCDLSGATTTGVAFTGANSMVRGGRVSVGNAATAISLGAASCRADDVDVLGSSSTTGVSLGAASTVCINCIVSGFTTGISVGAFANCKFYGNSCSSNTGDITISASATAFVEHSNTYTTLTDNTSASVPHGWILGRRTLAKFNRVADAGASVSFTPIFNGGLPVYNILRTDNAGVVALTVTNTATTGLVNDDLLHLVVMRSSGIITYTWGAQYVLDDGAGTVGSTTPGSQASSYYLFRWNASDSTWRAVFAVIGTLSVCSA